MQKVFENIIEILEEEKNDLTDWAEDIAFGLGIRRSIEIVKQAATEYNNGWIPCNERFPEEKEDVLVCFDNIDGCIIAWYDPNGDTWRNSSTDNVCKADPIVWLPLPAPYNPHIYTDNDCAFNEGKDCPAAEGCAGYERKRTNFDMCCESMEAMAQIIDIAKIGWTKEQIMEWLQKEECPVPD